MFIWNALAKADSSMLMALDMFAAIWFMDCCMAADTCVSSAVCICCMYAPSTFCYVRAHGRGDGRLQLALKRLRHGGDGLLHLCRQLLL